MVNYLLSKQEHVIVTKSEYYFKRTALFYFTMNFDYNSGLTNEATPYKPMTYLDSSDYTDSFLWERDTYVPRICNSSGDIIYDAMTRRCRGMIHILII